MKINTEKSESRREFLKSGLRTLIFSGIISICGFLGWRRIRSAEDEYSCTINLPCKDCSKYADCTDPNAVKLKQNISSKY
ncbi:hypothetical protein ACFL40_01230 [candidate division KSB1 bacterium]